MEIRAAIEHVHRTEWAQVLASTVRVARDLDLAQECAQDAFAQALRSWPGTGVPRRPGAWLTTVARNRARDALARDTAFRRVLPMLVVDETSGADVPERQVLDDDRLRLIFTCCHPALSGDAQVALTLRLICGMSTAEVARAFLVQESTMAARITRAKKKIARARIPYRVPGLAELPMRVGAVLDVLHLIFATGHSAPLGDQLVRGDLVDRALGLARMLHALVPADRDAAGLLALMLLVDARRDSRLSASGDLVLLAAQDRTRWDTAMIGEGIELLTEALRQGPPGRFSLEAAIAAVHAEAPSWESTDWNEIVGLYELLHRQWPSPVVELNRAVALGVRDGPAAGLLALEPLLEEPALATYGYLSAARADFLRHLGRRQEAAAAYEEALALTDNAVERAFLTERLADVTR